MKIEKIKNYNQKILVILGTITIIIGIVFILKTIKETEDVGESLNVFAFRKPDSRYFKNYNPMSIRNSIVTRDLIKFQEYKDSVKGRLTKITDNKKQLQRIIDRNKLQDTIKDKYEKRINEYEKRIGILEKTIINFDILESSVCKFKLNPIDSSSGNLTYDQNENVVSINYIRNNIPNFVHEMTHAYQFLKGGIAFTKNSEKPFAIDLFDEVSAYKAQYAYDPISVIKEILSDSIVNNLIDIDTSWVRGIRDPIKKNHLYHKTHYAIKNININTPVKELDDAYPKINYDSLKLKHLYMGIITYENCKR
ncbi:hypothetical protein [Flavivirga spongiicola]|uniref:DUF4157 domain-containing protein n=1 Tax=Flavivirga spongiicola TaxID=421621 RepID=A0ABU7XLY3_9FLAO|nr:hypothetical protein [Flavivirga sp. MEBiC05379]MDO5981419.1 hypothetical protein [Flavivirga sp. MEBiC05379]